MIREETCLWQWQLQLPYAQTQKTLYEHGKQCGSWWAAQTTGNQDLKRKRCHAYTEKLSYLLVCQPQTATIWRHFHWPGLRVLYDLQILQTQSQILRSRNMMSKVVVIKLHNLRSFLYPQTKTSVTSKQKSIIHTVPSLAWGPNRDLTEAKVFLRVNSGDHNAIVQPRNTHHSKQWAWVT